jgi:hypothetical protein
MSEEKWRKTRKIDRNWEREGEGGGEKREVGKRGRRRLKMSESEKKGVGRELALICKMEGEDEIGFMISCRSTNNCYHMVSSRSFKEMICKNVLRNLPKRAQPPRSNY